MQAGRDKMDWFKQYKLNTVIDGILNKYAAYKTVPVHEYRRLHNQVSDLTKGIYDGLNGLNTELAYGDVTELDEYLNNIDKAIIDLNGYLESGEITDFHNIPNLASNPILGLERLLHDLYKRFRVVLSDPNISRSPELTDRISGQKQGIEHLVQKVQALQ